MTADDAACVRRAMAGDQGARDVLWRAHRGWIAAVLLAHMPAEAELDDLLQEAAVAMIQALPTLARPESIAPWLRGIARNVARGAARRAIRQRRRDPRDPACAPPAGAGADGDDRAAARRAMAVVQALPEIYREPILLAAVRGLDGPRIADVLDLPLKTVQTRLRRARLLLRDALDPAEAPPIAAPCTNGRLEGPRS
jgi:RNA polymerase sigma-70 factor (ECF subfamily)